MENQLKLTLSKNKLLKNVELSNMDLSHVKGKLITIGEGEILFREGDFADYIYLVISGEVNLLKKRLLGKTKSFIFGENDFLGHEELIEETSRTSTAVALRDSYLVALLKEEVDELIRQDSRILDYMREPQAPGDDDIIAKPKISMPTISSDEKAKTSSYTVTSQTDFSNTEQNKPDDNSETQTFFQSISDSSRLNEEPLVQPLEKQQPEFEEEKSSLPDIPFNPNIFDEDGIMKPEFELPDIEPEEEKLFVSEKYNPPSPKTESKEEDLNDALFNILSGAEPQATEVLSNNSDIKFNEPLSAEESDPFFSSFNFDEEPVKQMDKPDLQKSFDEPLAANTPKNLDELEGFSSEEVKLPPVFKHSKAGFDDESIYAEVDEHLKSLSMDAAPPHGKTEIESKAQGRPGAESKGMSYNELEMIIKAAELVNSNIRIDEVLKNIVDVAREITMADRGTLYLVEKEKNEIWSLVVSGNEVREFRLKIGEGLAGYVAKTGETINIKDAHADPRFNKEFDKASGYKTKDMICFALKNNKGEIIGVLQLINSGKGEFTKRDEEFLTALSIHSAIAIQNAELVEKLLQTERVHSLGKMANFLIQDIKKPILVSKRYAEHLQGKQLTPDNLQIVQMLLEQLVQVADLVQTTSSYSEGKTMLRIVNASINNTLTDFASRVETYVSSRNCQLHCEYDKDVTVKLDIKEFFQTYMHIIKNACDAMPDGGNIYINTKKDDKKVSIMFKDSGLGISETNKEKIFEPFMTFGKKDGTGLGLAITRKIIEAHNGTIGVESSLGNGATFIVTLPTTSLY